MLLEEIKNIKSKKKDLRDFGLVIGIALGLLALLLWWKGKEVFPVFVYLGTAFIFLGLFLPVVLKPLQKVWMMFAVVMGWFMTRLILGVLFYIVFTLIGGIPRLFGKQFLNLKTDKIKDSFWQYREKKPLDKSSYEKQF